MSTKRRSNFIARSWYIGSGNKFSVFTRKPNIPFEKIKGMYGDALERLSTYPNGSIRIHKLSDSERFQLKENVKKMIVQNRRKTIVSFVITIIVTILIFILGFYLVKFMIQYYS